MKQFKSLAAIPLFMALFFISCNNGTDEKKTEATTTGDTSAIKAPETPAPVKPWNSMVIIHKVANYAKWLPAYESDDSSRMASGLHNYVLARGLGNDSNTVMIALKMDDAGKAKAMAGSPALKDKMKQGGVTGMPTIYYEENVVTDTPALAAATVRLMMTHKVKDWDAWKKEFDSHKQVRIDAGMIDRIVGHDVDDPHMVRIVFAITDMAKAKAFMDSKELKDKMTAAGVEGPPTAFFYTIAKKY
jgi:hypothetical protein